MTNIRIFEYIRIYLLTNIRIRIWPRIFEYEYTKKYLQIFVNIRKYINILLFIEISFKIVDFYLFS